MHDGDTLTGRVLTRREAFVLLGAALALRPARAAAAPACVVRPQQTLGPYFVDEGLQRSDIRSDPATGMTPAGAVLGLVFNVSRVGAGTCTPLAGARVDLWQCDARGAYSDVTDPRGSTVGQKFLRGHQVTDDAGTARFTTIYPGWYEGRTVHVHFRIVTPARAEFASQLYFDDALTDRVHALAPYTGRGPRTVRNDHDGLFRRGGARLMPAVTRDGDGYRATFDVGLAAA